ncbi:malate synthase G [Paraglaciecola sp. 20A4]|uniref:malate synthase G n=1 Tax=Paraglaciecola sp. 20A4 TaxID=2687288 RepID=UPI0014089CDF|nr:malate synthase G [Paraglaciecola sp. 20A4]
MQDYIQRGQLQVAKQLDTFIEEQALPGSDVTSSVFWARFSEIVAELTPVNKALLAKRDTLQQKIDEYCQTRSSLVTDEYKSFLREIGYLETPPDDFAITTDKVDAEVATMAGAQLVVPINNARFALNAANARWGSLYDAAYGTDVIPQDNDTTRAKGYDPVRGQLVIEYARKWLDVIAPLTKGSHLDSQHYDITSGQLVVTLKDGNTAALTSPANFIGYCGDISAPAAILLRHHGLHAELQFDRTHQVGQSDPAGMKDILLESALTTIMDCEDSVTAVDAQDKTLVYQNWLGLIKGNLEVSMQKSGSASVRRLNDDRSYISTDGKPFSLSGRSMMFVRNVGHLMTNDAILFDGKPIYEGIMDAVITSLIAKHDLLGNGKYKNSKNGSIYIVKPKMHGSEEVAYADTLFSQVEDALALPRNTLKMGIMDEERRTSVNLKACINAAKARAVFINTGFLDRTGDEIHTSMHLGPFALKAEIKQQPWLTAYELANVKIGIDAGMSGKAQIGKGMWPTPDNMADMMQSKTAHPQSGANTAWVPSPTAATLHALHYHQIDVFNLRNAIAETPFDGLDDILTVPLLKNRAALSKQDIQRELDNNVQGILGYVVRWVHQGIGCSKVPDIHNVGLMEDRATLRISSQHIANWLLHGLIDESQINDSMLRMAKLVDEQNSTDAEYIAMMPDPIQSIAFQAAQELILKGTAQPNGYTEPVLHAKRREMKQKRNS